jgi:hypothetical protein
MLNADKGVSAVHMGLKKVAIQDVSDKSERTDLDVTNGRQ